MNISDNVEAEVIRQYELGYLLKMIEAYYAENRGMLHVKKHKED